MDFVNEVYVGRIPVYAGVAQLDSVLSKIIAFGTETNTGWRKNCLFPMSFLWPDAPGSDGAYLAEAMISDYLAPVGIGYYRLYMQGSVCPEMDSTFVSEEELLDGATKIRWSNNDYGLVWWHGHGSPTGTGIGYGSTCSGGTLFSSADASALDNSHPSTVFQGSCSNGYPENNNNLGTSLLYNGAISTVSASRVSYGLVGPWDPNDKYICDNDSIGYYYGLELIKNHKKAGNALFIVKSDMGSNAGDGTAWANLFNYNFYGDPSYYLLYSTLSLSKGGTGNGQVLVGGNPTPHELPYSETFPAGFALAIEAMPSPGSMFTSWSGDLNSTANPALIILNDNMDITANFELEYSISGYVRDSGGVGIQGVVMSGLPNTPSTGSTGYYFDTVPSGWSGTVTPQKAGYTFTPPSTLYGSVTSSQTTDYTGMLPPPPCQISGYVRDKDSNGIESVNMNYGEPEIIDQEQKSRDYGYGLDLSYEHWQEFRPTTAKLARVDTLIYRVGNSGDLIFSIRDSGGQTLWNNSISMDTIPMGENWISVPIEPTLNLVPEAGYKIHLSTSISSPDVQNRYVWYGKLNSAYSRGVSSGTSDFDFGFRTYRGDASILTDLQGYYSLLVASGWSGTVTPTKADYSFSPTSTSYMNVTSNKVTNYTGTPIFISLLEALDNSGLVITTGGDKPWFGQGTTYYYGGDAAQSGSITDNQQSYFQATVTGPGSLTFFWKVSSEEGYDYLGFYIDDALQVASISGEVDWQQKTYAIPVGVHNLRWRYWKDSSESFGSDSGWVDMVKFANNKKDFNEDGREDILWRHYGAGLNYVWYMDGLAVIVGELLPTISDTNWQIAGTGDFNGDAKIDILWRYYGGGGSQGINYVWYMDGATVTGGALLPTISDTTWQIVGTGDFNGDGKVDILWRHYGTGQNYVWYMNGVTVTAGALLPTISDTNWQIQGTGDFNNDGKVDILWRHYGTGQNYVWYMDGVAVTGGALLPTISDTGWQIEGTGDFSGDGKVDILWRHYGTGQNYVWYMDGVTVAAGELLETVPDLYWRIENH